jgi:hypothetical protein
MAGTSWEGGKRLIGRLEIVTPSAPPPALEFLNPWSAYDEVSGGTLRITRQRRPICRCPLPNLYWVMDHFSVGGPFI